jgi:hypothetical protein
LGWRPRIPLTCCLVWITFWESEEAMVASEEAANRLPEEETVEVAGGMVAGVERYEVGLFELES